MSGIKATGEDSDKDKEKEKSEVGINGVQELLPLPLSLKALVGPLKSELLLLCRIAKEKLSDDALSHVTVRFPAAVIRKYSGEYVMLRGKRIYVEENIGANDDDDDDDDDDDEGREKEEEGEGLEREEVEEEEEEEEEFKWAIMSQDKDEGDEADFVIEILREEFEAACLPVLEVHHTTSHHHHPTVSLPYHILSYFMLSYSYLSYHIFAYPVLCAPPSFHLGSISRPFIDI